MGVRKQHEADMAMPMVMGRGDMPVASAIGRAKGAIKAAVAVLDIKLVMAAVRAQHTNMSIQGLLTVLTTVLATMAAAPDLSIAADMESMPANRKMVVQSTLRNASRMVMQPVITIRQAPSTAAVVRGMISLAIMATTKAKISTECHILCSRRTLASTSISSSVASCSFSGKNLWPIMA